MVPVICLALLFTASPVPSATATNFYDDFEIIWGKDGRANILEDGKILTLSLDNISGAGFQSKNEYMFGNISMQIKLIPGNSAGTVTAFYLASEGSEHDEIDFEFLGNLSGQPYTVHTNVYSQGKGKKEEQFHLWFDPTADFHTYTFLWLPNRIIFAIDNVPIREFRNLEEVLGIGYPKRNPMKLYSTLWNADQWATMGGSVKTNWTLAPFTAIYRNFETYACVKNKGSSSETCPPLSNEYYELKWLDQRLGPTYRGKMNWVRENYMIYNYCNDTGRFPQGLPLECSFPNSTID